MKTKTLTKRRARRRVRTHQLLFWVDHGRCPQLILAPWPIIEALLANGANGIYDEDWKPPRGCEKFFEKWSMTFEGSTIGVVDTLRDDQLVSPI